MVSIRRATAVTGVAFLIAAALPAAGAAGGQATALPGWRVVKHFGTGGAFGAVSVTATGARNAWTTGQAFGIPCDSSLLIAHWDGRAWRELSPPKEFCGRSEEWFGTAVAARSASYSWTFVNRYLAPPAEEEQSFALLRSGHRWRAFRLADGLRVTSARVFSHSDAWAFGTFNGPEFAAGPRVYAEHFNGRNWRPVTAPVTAFDAAFPGPQNIWVVGRVRQSALRSPIALVRWTGRWHKPILLPASIGPTAAHIYTAWVVPSADGPWVAVRDWCCNNPNGGALVHWTGSRWQIIKVPFPTYGLGPLARDGHGGLWIGSATCSGCQGDTIYHYSAGTWSAPLNIGLTMTAMRLIPGTDSVWASGSVAAPGGSGDVISAVAKYGS
jgi:hypothetical protein